ncbi:alpha-glucosidase [Pseudomonas sp. 21]|uniref:alpha-glucosidase n=1 Tax=Pseudomonas sp. 21 TaxID=1619948 RepID=UPI0012DFFA55|nr:alpha-glucosidase [Pseudomonas sp. 21]
MIRFLLRGGAVLLALGVLAFGGWKGWQWWQQRPVWAQLTVAPAMAAGQSWKLGDYRLEWDGASFALLAGEHPAQTLWQTRGGFLAAGIGRVEAEEHRGAMFIHEHRERLCRQQQLTAVRAEADRLLISGTLGCADGRQAPYTLALRADGERGVVMDVSLGDPALNRLYLAWAREADEQFHGFGEQFTRFDLSGRRLPILVQEQGVGRGLQPITLAADLSARAGGDWWTTYAPVPFYLTSRLHGFFSEASEYQVFDLRDDQRVALEVHAGKLKAHFYKGNSPKALIEAHTSVVGRMPPLPAWTQQGAILGLQGGTERVRGIVHQLEQAKVPLAGVWVQDWVGQRTTSFGKQLWWNWVLDGERYPGWLAFNAELRAKGVRSLAYVNPFLVDTAEKGGATRNLYREALDHGYLTLDQQGQPLLLQNTSFSAGLVDLTNPRAADWLRGVMREEMLGAGFSGWMADFGEALPYEAKLASGEPASVLHNRYPELWAKLNRQLVDAEGPGELLFFMRSAYSRSPGLTTSLWLGDQLVTWDADDGLHSALLGLLSGGVSGFSLNHSDTGGYTTISSPIRNYHRSEELLLRWMEFSAFTSLLRTHEGNRPDDNVQAYSAPATVAQLQRFATVFRELAPYRRRLMDEAAQHGWPLVRPLWLEFPADPASLAETPTSYMLGDQFLVAPVLEPGVQRLSVTLPEGRWVHLWSGSTFEVASGGVVEVPAPIGEPAVFYRAGSADGEHLVEALREQGLLRSNP